MMSKILQSVSNVEKKSVNECRAAIASGKHGVKRGTGRRAHEEHPPQI